MSAVRKRSSGTPMTPDQTIAKYAVALSYLPAQKRPKGMSRGYVYSFAATLPGASLSGVTTVAAERSTGKVTYETVLDPIKVGAFSYKDLKIIAQVKKDGKSSVEVRFSHGEATTTAEFPAVDVAFFHALGRIGLAIPFIDDIYVTRQGKNTKGLFPLANREEVLQQFATGTTTFDLRANEIEMHTAVVLSARGSTKPSMQGIDFRIFDSYDYREEEGVFVLSARLTFNDGHNYLDIDLIFNPETGVNRLNIKGMQRLSELIGDLLPMLQSKMLKHIGRRFVVSTVLQHVVKREELKPLKAPLTLPVTFKHMGWAPSTFSLATGKLVGV